MLPYHYTLYNKVSMTTEYDEETTEQ